MTLNITHNDLDGASCAIMVKKAIPSVHTFYTNYDELKNVIDDIPDKYSTVIITDLGPSEADLKKLAGEKELLLIDHHKTTQQYAGYPFVYHSIEKSATLLTYEYFKNKGAELNKYENYVDCVNDFDLWIMKRKDSLQMNILFNLLGVDRFVKRFLDNPYDGFSREEELVITLEEERRDSYIRKAMQTVQYFKDEFNRTFGAVFSEQYASELGNAILQDGRADYVVLINVQKKKVSLRSIREVDISNIASKNGGGGHKNAAGFNLPQSLDLNNILKKAGILI